MGWAGASFAQESLPSKPTARPVATHPARGNNGGVPCIQPTPMVKLQDYNGPFEKVIGLFTQQLELKSIHPVHYKSGAVLCTLEIKDKFLLFVRDSYEPIVFLDIATRASLSQADDRDPTFGQGMAGYGKRLVAAYADQASFRFFKDFAFPTVFDEDPRYYRLGSGGGRNRFLHAIEHSVIAHSDDGEPIFNFSEWMGTASAVSLSNFYHPGHKRGFGPSAERVGIDVLGDMGADVLREFWPEIAHKLRLPFRADPSDPDIEVVPTID